MWDVKPFDFFLLFLQTYCFTLTMWDVKLENLLIDLTIEPVLP